MQWRWQVDSAPGGPEHNMEADAALLAELASEADAESVVRVYTWDQKSVSIGRLQREEPVQTLYPGLILVRRPTGGRAVIHGEDFTITTALRLEHLPAECRSVLASHQRLMDAVKEALKAIGVESVYGGCPIASQKAVVNCFELAASCDLVDGHTGEKLVGSAQRREGSAILQQMSLPLRYVPDRSAFLGFLRTEYDKIFGLITC